MTTQLEILDINAKYFVKSFVGAKGRPCAQLFAKTPKGKYSKEKMVSNYIFGDETFRYNWFVKQTNSILEGDRKEVERKNERKNGAKAAIENGAVQVGSIFVYSWGYDQTNVDFYEVVAAKGSTVTVREVWQKEVESGRDCGRVVARKGEYKGEPMQKRLSMAGGTPCISIESYGYCRLWDGKPAYYSTGH